mmetsp:Transcript_91440/g.258248  ORF Transcript_91440/g.258248 Transcript_91440/m.258248 type:complete len:240 (-) Transcript_91440:642-1361(-)
MSSSSSFCSSAAASSSSPSANSSSTPTSASPSASRRPAASASSTSWALTWSSSAGASSSGSSSISTSSPSASSSPSPAAGISAWLPRRAPARPPRTRMLKAKGQARRRSSGSSMSKDIRSPHFKSTPSGISSCGICASCPQTSEMSWQKTKCLPVIADFFLTIPDIVMIGPSARLTAPPPLGTGAPLPAAPAPPLPPPLAPLRACRAACLMPSASSPSAFRTSLAIGAASTWRGASTQK